MSQESLHVVDEPPLLQVTPVAQAGAVLLGGRVKNVGRAFLKKNSLKLF